MLPDKLQHSTNNNLWPVAEFGKDPSVLTSIYEANVNIAVWQRERQQLLDTYANEWVKRYPSHAPKLLLSVANVTDQLDKLLPDLDETTSFKQDVALLVEMFACLFDTDEVGLRLSPLTTAMCPRFHVDNIPCRLVTTYGGLGTQWLLEENLDRSRLGKGAGGLPDHESGIFNNEQAIQQLNSQHIALLKGSGWVGNEDYGIVHRSPHLPSGQMRLLLTLDFL